MVIGEEKAVKAYKATEKFFVEGYENVSDRFVDTFFTKNGENIEESKKRLKNNLQKSKDKR